LKHFILSYFILSFAVGFLALSITIFLYFRYRYKIIQYYLYFLLALTYSFILNSYNFYRQVFIQSDSLIYSLVYLNLRVLGFAAIIYMIPLFFLRFLEKPFRVVEKAFFLLVSGSALIAIAGVFFIGKDTAQRIALSLYGMKIYSGLRILTIIYILILAVFYRKKEKTYEVKLFIRALMITTAVLLPLNIIDLLASPLGFIYASKQVNVSNLALFYLVWNIVTLGFAAWYFSHRIDKVKANDLIDIVARNFSITEREKEIILMISQGNSNKDIKDKLFISLPTVKTHIRNIYQKTGVKNRVELINLLRK
jgi:DNA-binding CsgD family transcriptional regulator